MKIILQMMISLMISLVMIKKAYKGVDIINGSIILAKGDRNV